MSQQDKLEKFIDGFAQRTGEVSIQQTDTPGRLQFTVTMQHDTHTLSALLLIFYGRIFRSGEVLLTDLEEAEDVEIRFGAQIHYDKPVEPYQVDYFKQAFTELARHMETGASGEAELIDNEQMIGMRISRSSGLKFREHESAFRKAGLNFGTQTLKDAVKLMEYAALPL